MCKQGTRAHLELAGQFIAQQKQKPNNVHALKVKRVGNKLPALHLTYPKPFFNLKKTVTIQHIILFVGHPRENESRKTCAASPGHEYRTIKRNLGTPKGWQ